MREILFRAKAKCDPGRGCRTTYKKGNWIYGLITSLCDGVFATMKNTDGMDGIDVDQSTIGQYTGLNDTKCNKIFEGDILQVNCNCHGYEIGRVRIYYKFAMYLCDVIYGDIDFDTLGMLDANYQLKVIGNIYDNPELLSERE